MFKDIEILNFYPIFIQLKGRGHLEIVIHLYMQHKCKSVKEKTLCDC